MIQKAGLAELEILTKLVLLLWPEHEPKELKAELRESLQHPDAVFFLAYEQGSAVGFAQCQLRNDYVEGTSSSPVGYLEGIYVAEAYRKKGIAGMLLSACENWAKEQGCCEFASDCELNNSHSLQFHLRMGFTEANRIICFTKHL